MAMMSPAARALRQMQASGFGTASAAASSSVQGSTRHHPPRSSLKSDQDLTRLLHAFGQQQPDSAPNQVPPVRDATQPSAERKRSLSELKNESKGDAVRPPPNTGLQPPPPPPRKSSLSGPRPQVSPRSHSAAAAAGGGGGLLRRPSAHTPREARPNGHQGMPRLTLPSHTHPARWFAVGLHHHAAGLVQAIGLGAACQAVLGSLQQEADCQGELEDLLGDECFAFISTLLASREVLLAHKSSILRAALRNGEVSPDPAPPRTGAAGSTQQGTAPTSKATQPQQAPAQAESTPHKSLSERGAWSSPAKHDMFKQQQQQALPPQRAAYSLGQEAEVSDFDGDLFQDTPSGAADASPYAAAVYSSPEARATAASAMAAAAAAPSLLADCMDADMARKRASALSELINSEANYIALLLRLVNAFLLPSVPQCSRPDVQPVGECLKGTALDLVQSAQKGLSGPSTSVDKHADNAQTAQLSEGEHTALFRQVQLLLPLHYSLLQHLVGAAQRAHALADQTDFLFGAEGEGGAAGSRMDCVTPHTAPFVCVGALVEHCARSFARAYAPYVAGHGTALQLLGDLTGGHKRFTEWLRTSEAACGGQTLQSFLIMPVQRIPRYALLLKEVVQTTPAAHPEYGMLVQALKTSKQAAQDINTAVADVAEREKVGALQAALSPAPAPSLVTLGARIIKCGWLDKITGGTGLREYLVVLLPMQLVYASVNRPSEDLMRHRDKYKQAAYRLGHPDTRLGTQERKSLHDMRVAYHAAEDAAGDSGDEGVAAAKQHAVHIWDAVPDPAKHGILPNEELQLEGVSLSLHNAIVLTNVLAKTVQGKPALRVEGPPKCITLVFNSTAERDEWAFATRAMLQKAEELAQAAQLGEGGYGSVWAPEGK